MPLVPWFGTEWANGKVGEPRDHCSAKMLDILPTFWFPLTRGFFVLEGPEERKYPLTYLAYPRPP
jgi:hypothetical protein